MNLMDIIQAAHGGQGVNNLAAQFGITPDQAQSAVAAVMPAFSQGLQRTAQDPTGLGGVLSQLTSGAHQGSFTDPAQAATAGAGAGGDVLGQIFGSPQVTAQISQRAAQATGLSPQMIQEMMPVLASMLMGGLAHSMTSQGLGGVLGQLASAATGPGGLGAALGQGGQAGAGGGGLFGGLIGNVLGGLFGGGAQAGAGAPSSPMQAGLNTLSSMFEPGVPVSQAHQQGISDILNSVSSELGGGQSRN